MLITVLSLRTHERTKQTKKSLILWSLYSSLYLKMFVYNNILIWSSGPLSQAVQKNCAFCKHHPLPQRKQLSSQEHRLEKPAGHVSICLASPAGNIIPSFNLFERHIYKLLRKRTKVFIHNLLEITYYHVKPSFGL